VVETGGEALGAKEVKAVVQGAIKDAVKEVAEENDLNIVLSQLFPL
jgi:Skp family chaperone for outer membrane proteins